MNPAALPVLEIGRHKVGPHQRGQRAAEDLLPARTRPRSALREDMRLLGGPSAPGGLRLNYSCSVTGLDGVERDADDGAMVRGDVHGPAEVGAGMRLHQVSDHPVAE